MAYKMKMYDPKGNLMDVDRNKQDSLLSQGYSFKKPTNTQAGVSTGIQGGGIAPIDPYSDIPLAQPLSQQFAPIDPYSNIPLAPITDPHEEELTEYRKQIEALSMETDPDYDENLEQVISEEMEEVIL